MATAKVDTATLKLYTPALPSIGGNLDVLSLENQLFLENCADRLTALSGDGATRLKALEAVSLSLDGLTQRFTLRKGLMFHCGSEVTAADAVASLVRVCKLPQSVSQLGKYIARDKGEQHGYAIYSVSRYRFELKLIRRIDDLLVRLAMPETSLRHDGRPCFSGLWKSVEQDSRGLLLAVHESHPDAGDCQYQGVRWEALAPELDDPTVFGAPTRAEPYALVYPGTRLKSPPDELLADEICRPLDAGTSLVLRAHPQSVPVTAELRSRFARAVSEAFGGKSLWHRSPLTTLVPRGHALHATFPVECPPHLDGRLALIVAARSPLFPDHMWDKLQRIAAESWQLDVKRVDVYPSPLARDTPCVEMISVFHDHAADVRTPMSCLDPSGLFDVGHGRSDAAHELVKSRQLIPLIHVPFVVRANRNVRRREGAGLLQFVDVRQSADLMRKTRLKDAVLRGLGEAVQMFAHDVRRPLSLMQGILGLLEASEEPERARALAARYLPDVRRASSAADRMIQDILEIGSDAEPVLEDVELAPLIAAAVKDVFAATAPDNIHFSYTLEHTHRLSVDPRKVVRVIANILSNAAEAMQLTGTISFEASAHQTESVTLLTISNTNSYIPPERIEGLFDRFFTQGKKQGTGLGLAIVRKIVNDHGGDVWCESDRETGTRFSMSLPSSSMLRVRTDEMELPSDGRGAGLGADSRRELDDTSVVARLASVGGVTLLVVDDDPLYLAVMEELLPLAWRRPGGVRVITAVNADEAFEKMDDTVNVAIVDVDLGRHSIDGLALVRQLRAMRPGVRICVHSHGAPFELTRQAVQAGGDLFLPKPMAREHLVKLIQSILPTIGTSLAKIAVVDDDALMLEMWQVQTSVAWSAFDSPEALLAAVAANPDLVKEWAGVVTDLTFVGSRSDGLDLAARLKQMRPSLPIFLATDKPIGDAVPKAVDRVIKKNPETAMAVIMATLAT